jgi:hypothetical protein
MKITEIARKLGATFFYVKSYACIKLDKECVGAIFYKLIWSPWLRSQVKAGLRNKIIYVRMYECMYSL